MATFQARSKRCWLKRGTSLPVLVLTARHHRLSPRLKVLVSRGLAKLVLRADTEGCAILICKLLATKTSSSLGEQVFVGTVQYKVSARMTVCTEDKERDPEARFSGKRFFLVFLFGLSFWATRAQSTNNTCLFRCRHLHPYHYHYPPTLQPSTPLLTSNFPFLVVDIGLNRAQQAPCPTDTIAIERCGCANIDPQHLPLLPPLWTPSLSPYRPFVHTKSQHPTRNHPPISSLTLNPPPPHLLQMSPNRPSKSATVKRKMLRS